MEVCGQFHAPAFLLQGNNPGIHLSRLLGWPNPSASLDGLGDEKNHLELPGFEPRFFQPVS